MITKPILRIENIVNVLIVVSFLLSIGATTVECQQNTKNPICDREKFKIGVLQGENKPFIFVIEKEQKRNNLKMAKMTPIKSCGQFFIPQSLVGEKK